MARRGLIGASLLGLLGCGAAAAAQTPYKPPIQATCRPDSVSIGLTQQRTSNPIAYALEQAGPGSVIRLTPGVYRGFSIGQAGRSDYNARCSGRPGLPITIEGVGDVRIQAAGGDTILVAQQVPCGHILFRNLTIEAGYRSAVMFARGGVHDGFRFHDCVISGGYDHGRKTGRASKWGIHGHSLKDFEFRGVMRPAKVVNLRDEHGFYLQNCQGNVTIDNVIGACLGRTFVQITARSGEGAVGMGTITLRNCQVRDCGLAPGDNHKGGFAFTFAGRHNGEILVERCTYRAGGDPRLLHLHAAGEPYGTGALVATASGEPIPIRRLVLRDNEFVFTKSTGDRPVVQISGVADVRIEGRNTFRAGAYGVALRVDPVGDDGRPPALPVKNLLISPDTVLGGTAERRGQPLALPGRAGVPSGG